MVNTEADLQYGRTENTVRKNPNIDSRFQINSPTAVSSVRGTDFRYERTPLTIPLKPLPDVYMNLCCYSVKFIMK
ncbi:hypothetical protein NMYAN_20037 [Nitrosomonas nitrosa]|uniref:FecR family protein n=1 Tax=Nitrosomonas nitrosa TaxID=52442 RepID=A0A1I4QAH9_9PROT|nr:hypothetical protein NMYAN_20037 [Nitrosomonas nitrosa]SFM37057.1 FecR family protein [Nitrosomonas nitrosa]